MGIIEQLESTKSALTAKQLSELLNVTRQHISKLAARGRIPSFTVGGAVRFDPKQVAEWLRRHD